MELPGFISDTSPIKDDNLEVDQLQILIHAALERQLPEISREICREVSNKTDFMPKASGVQQASPIHQPNTPAVVSKFGKQPTHGGDGTTPSNSAPVVSKLQEQSTRSLCTRLQINSQPVLAQIDRASRSETSSSRGTGALTWLGTPTWQRRQSTQSQNIDKTQAVGMPRAGEECDDTPASQSALRVTATPANGFDLRHVESEYSLPDELFDRPLAKIVLWEAFDFTAGVLVFLSTLFIGVKCDYLLRNSVWYVTELEVTQMAFYVCFVIEIIMRLCVFRRSYFTVDGWEWNVLDLFLALYQTGQTIYEYSMYTHRDDLDTFWHIHRPTPFVIYLRFLRFLRVLRMIRSARLQKYITEFRLMAASVLNSIRYLIWACLILLVFVYVCAVHISLMVSRYAAKHPDDLAPGTLLHKRWGSLPRAMFSLFQAVTGGEDWSLLLSPLFVTSISAAGIFCLYICFTYLYLMNIITGVFVEAAISEAHTISESNLVNRLRAMFKMQDIDDDGRLTFLDFQRLVCDTKVRKTFHSLGLDVDAAEHLFMMMDIDGSGAVSSAEFMTGCLRLRGTAKSIDVATLLYECRRTKKLVQIVHEHLVKKSDKAHRTSFVDLT